MMAIYSNSFTSRLALLLLLASYQVSAIQWKQCLQDIQNHSEGEDYTKNSTLFHKESTPSNPILTSTGCEALCGGSRTHLYPDSGAIINTWILPALVRIIKPTLQFVLLTRAGNPHPKSSTRR